LCPQSFGNGLHMTQAIMGYGAFLVQLYAYCWFGGELTQLVRNWYPYLAYGIHDYFRFISAVQIPVTVP
jgi:hypothetical protein